MLVNPSNVSVRSFFLFRWVTVSLSAVFACFVTMRCNAWRDGKETASRSHWINCRISGLSITEYGRLAEVHALANSLPNSERSSGNSCLPTNTSIDCYFIPQFDDEGVSLTGGSEVVICYLGHGWDGGGCRCFSLSWICSASSWCTRVFTVVGTSRHFIIWLYIVDLPPPPMAFLVPSAAVQ